MSQVTKKQIVEGILNGKIFIYPTDTLYGLGCNAMNLASVDKIRQIKGRDSKPFSVIAPNLDWIYDNFIVDFDIKEYLPGPYTILLKKKFPEFLSHVSKSDLVGIRIPQHKFTQLVQRASVPFITTSVNESGSSPARFVADISQKIKSQVDIIIENLGKYKDSMSLKASTLILNNQEIKR